MQIIKVKNGVYKEYEMLLLQRDQYRKEALQILIAYAKRFGDLINSVFEKQGGCIRLKFPDEEALAPAVEDLIERRKIFDIPAVREQNVRSLRYTASDMGTLTVWLLP